MADEAVVKIQDRRGRKYMAYLLEQYHKTHPDEDSAQVEPHLVARWAIKKGIYQRPPIKPEDRLRRELSRYLKTEYATDPQGRQVRKHHAIIYFVETADGLKRRSRWFELYSAPPDQIRAAFQIRRRMAYQDVHQLNIDFESYNDNNVLGAKLEPMDYDFNKDLAEKKMPTTYPDEAPEGEVSEADDDFDDEEIN